MDKDQALERLFKEATDSMSVQDEVSPQALAAEADETGSDETPDETKPIVESNDGGKAPAEETDGAEDQVPGPNNLV